MVLNDRAVSEEVGSILLIAVVVAVIGISSANLFSSISTELPPEAHLVSSNTPSALYIRHGGGDPLDRDLVQIIVDGEDVTGEMELVTPDGTTTDWTTFSNGMTLRYRTEDPGGIMVIYRGPEVQEVIYTAGEVVPVSIPTHTPTPTPGEAPLADFTADPTSGTLPLTVQFTDTSTGSPTSWSWEFGDGDTSTAQNPVHTYATTGTYTVTLTVANAYGSDTETKTDHITVGEPLPAVIFSDDFEDGDYNGWTKTWDFIHMTSSPAIGNYAVELVKYGDMERTIPTTGHSHINVSFWMGAYKLEGTESVRAYWTSDGSNWTLLKQITNGDPEEDGELHPFSFELPPSADDNPDFGLRFGIWGSRRREYGYVDNVRVEGI